MKRQRPKKSIDVAMNDALRLVSPGTPLREGISAILQSGNGALICIGDAKLLGDLSEGGVELNAPFTPQLLYELTKMDGAILLSDDGSRIIYANRFLTPDNSISTYETGTRHRAAERIAKEGHSVVIALSERRGSVTLYVQDRKRILDSIATLLNKATQAIQALEKYLGVMQEALVDLSAREFEDMVTIFDVCKAIQRCELARRIAAEIEPYIIELGTEGRLIEMQLKEMVTPLSEAEMIIKDYYREKPGLQFELVVERIREISESELLKLASVSQALGYGANIKNIDTYLSPRGYRLLNQTRRLTPQIIDNLIHRFGTLQQLMRATQEEFMEVEGIGEVLAERTRQSLDSLRSQLALDRGRRI